MYKHHSFLFRNWQACRTIGQVFLKAYVRKLGPFVPRYNAQVSQVIIRISISELQTLFNTRCYIQTRGIFISLVFNVFKIPYSTEITQLVCVLYYSYRVKKKSTLSYRHDSQDSVSPVITEESVYSFIPSDVLLHQIASN